MALYHCSVKAHGRARGGPAGTSAVALAAYRAAERLADERTGRVHDYRRKGGVAHAELVTPWGEPCRWSREAVWQAQERRVRRRDGVVARELELALPHELSPDAAIALAREQAAALARHYRTVVDCCVHTPVRQRRTAAPAGPGGDPRNVHVHLLIAPYQVRADGTVCDRVTALDPAPQYGGRAEVRRLRAEWATRCNAALERAGVRERVDHRTLAEQGIDRAPQTKRGRAATHYERRTGLPSRRGLQERRAADDSLLQRAARRAALKRDGVVVTPPALALPAVSAAPPPERLMSLFRSPHLQQPESPVHSLVREVAQPPPPRSNPIPDPAQQRAHQRSTQSRAR